MVTVAMFYYIFPIETIEGIDNKEFSVERKMILFIIFMLGAMVMISGCAVTAASDTGPPPVSSCAERITAEAANGLDKAFVTQLRVAGVITAAESIGLDFEKVLLPLAYSAVNPYRRYRWSVGSDASGNQLINAVPPEEELGWTPWERWFSKDGKPSRESWVLYPIRKVNVFDMPIWYALQEEPALTPRYLAQPERLEDRLRLARVDVASRLLGLDMRKELTEPLSPKARDIYAQFRWVVVPHRLAHDGPVIYALPPMHLSDQWPWESWYTDGEIPLIHHVHYTAQTPRTTGKWAEGVGAPQRPPEIFGVVWHWYDDSSMVPALATELP